MKLIEIVDKNGSVFRVNHTFIRTRILLKKQDSQIFVRVRMNDSGRTYFEDYSVADEQAGELLMQSIEDQINSL